MNFPGCRAQSNEAESFSEKNRKAEEKLANSIQIKIPQENSQEVMQKISEILKSSEDGDSEVYISIPTTNGNYKKIKTLNDIKKNEVILEKIKNIIGDENLK